MSEAFRRGSLATKRVPCTISLNNYRDMRLEHAQVVDVFGLVPITTPFGTHSVHFDILQHALVLNHGPKMKSTEQSAGMIPGGGSP